MGDSEYGMRSTIILPWWMLIHQQVCAYVLSREENCLWYSFCSFWQFLTLTILSRLCVQIVVYLMKLMCTLWTTYLLFYHFVGNVFHLTFLWNVKTLLIHCAAYIKGEWAAACHSLSRLVKRINCLEAILSYSLGKHDIFKVADVHPGAV